MLYEDMTANEAHYYILDMMRYHWKNFEKLNAKNGSMERTAKCAVINSHITALQKALDDWKYEKGHRKFTYGQKPNKK